MIHSHHMHPMHPSQINVSQPPPQMPQNMAQPNQQRMSHHHYQQRLSHQQVQQQIPAQIHGSRSNIGSLNQHQVPPPVIPKQHLHQNISTLNQKPPQHVTTNQQLSQNSQIQQTQRISYDKSFNQSSNLKRESNTKISVSATATLDPNNSSIVTGQQSASILLPSKSVLSHHHLQQQTNILPNKYIQQQTIPSDVSSDCKTPVVSANKDVVVATNASVVQSSLPCDLSAIEITEQGIDSLANTKEKTPMCLVNELARFNKILHQYRLISEQGPAHKKKFTVILKLGEEEYAAEGLSIKKAQHAAAKDAILKTSYKHPPLKANRLLKGVQACSKSNTGNITPTVELNALAMKRGEPTVYTVTSTTTPGTHGISSLPSTSHYNIHGASQFNRGPNPYQPRRFLNQRGGGSFQNGRLPPHYTETFHVTLQVGNRTFSGMGITQQAARHDAASRALEVIKPLSTEIESVANKTINSVSDNGDDSENGDESLINSDIKSPISIVHEMALKRKMSVTFEVQSEKGPPHMKVYTTFCQVGTIITEGEGNGKKLSKKKAAEKMMEELKKLPPLSPVEEPPNRLITRIRRKQLQQQQTSPPIKKKIRNLIKDKADAGTSLEELNPISQLIQIQQARKEKEPVYSVVDERGTARRREFVIEVCAGGMRASGTGPNKKVAKKIAAENLLVVMGLGKSTETPLKEKLRVESEKSKKVQFVEPDLGKKHSSISSAAGSSGRQIVPGLLLVSSTSENFLTPEKNNTPTTKSLSPASDDLTEKSSTSPASTVSNQDSGICESGVSARDQLNYLAQLIGFTVSYSDFPKGNHSDFLSLVTLSTDPPHMSHGSGSNVDESRDHAAVKALGAISELGLDNVKPKAK